MNPLSQIFGMNNPYQQAMKKHVYDILKEKYTVEHDETIVRLTHMLATEDDYKKLGKLIADLYEKGYLTAKEQYEDIFKKHGIRVKVVPQEKSG